MTRPPGSRTCPTILLQQSGVIRFIIVSHFVVSYGESNYRVIQLKENRVSERTKSVVGMAVTKCRPYPPQPHSTWSPGLVPGSYNISAQLISEAKHLQSRMVACQEGAKTSTSTSAPKVQKPQESCLLTKHQRRSSNRTPVSPALSDEIRHQQQYHTSRSTALAPCPPGLTAARRPPWLDQARCALHRH